LLPLRLIRMTMFMWRILIFLCMWLMIITFNVIVILLILFMMLLKVIMREGNMVLCFSIILSFPSLCWKSWSCTYFIYPCLLLCASLIYFLTRFLCIGSGLDLKVFHICFSMLSLLQILFWCLCLKLFSRAYMSIFSNYCA
jgi:hypothetical protein